MLLSCCHSHLGAQLTEKLFEKRSEAAKPRARPSHLVREVTKSGRKTARSVETAGVPVSLGARGAEKCAKIGPKRCTSISSGRN